MRTKLFLIISLVALMAIIGGKEVSAQLAGTANDTVISNSATVDAANVAAPSISTVTYSTVELIAGGSFTVVPVDITGAGAGSIQAFVITLKNDGNATDTFTMAVEATVQTNNTVVCDEASWVVSFSDSQLTGVPADTTAIFTMYVEVGSLAQEGAWVEYQINATSANDATAVRSGRYVGDNGNIYAGWMGVSYDGTVTNDDGIVRYETNQSALVANDDTWLRVSVSGPSLQITKIVNSVLLTTIGLAQEVPGATITYRVAISNMGPGNANDVTISDSIPDNTTWNDSVSITQPLNGGFNWYTNAGALVVTNSQDGALLGTNNTAAGVYDTIVITYEVTID